MQTDKNTNVKKVSALMYFALVYNSTHLIIQYIREKIADSTHVLNLDQNEYKCCLTDVF